MQKRATLGCPKDPSHQYSRADRQRCTGMRWWCGSGRIHACCQRGRCSCPGRWVPRHCPPASITWGALRHLASIVAVVAVHGSLRKCGRGALQALPGVHRAERHQTSARPSANAARLCPGHEHESHSTSTCRQRKATSTRHEVSQVICRKWSDLVGAGGAGVVVVVSHAVRVAAAAVERASLVDVCVAALRI